jgi:hypothetical protein
MKIVSSSKGIHSPEFHKKKTRERRIRLTIISIVALVAVAIPVYLLKTSRFQITNLVVVGNSVTQYEDIQKIVVDKINANYLWIFPKSNDAVYPKSAIKNTLFQNIPRLNSINISLSNPHTLVVSVTENSPSALYCTDTTNPVDPSGCYFLDKTGYIFSEAPSFSGGVYVVYTSQPLIDSPLKKSFLTPEKFAPLNNFLESLSKIGLSPKTFIDKGDEYNVVLSNNAVVMWKSSADLDTIQSDLESFLSDPNFLKERSGLQRILYIDLRFGSKVFYKFRD